MRMRLLAVAALVVFGLVLVTVAELVLSAPGILALLLLALVGVSFASWLIFIGKQWRFITGWILFLISVSALIKSLSLLRLEYENLLFIRLAVLLIIYVVIIGVLRKEYWRIRRQQAIQTKITAQFQRPILIINPKSGNGRAIKAGIPDKARELGIEVVITSKNDNIEELARRAADDGADVLGVSGGDGTLGAVAKVAIEKNLPLVILPGGTRCHFTRDVGFDPKQIGDALTSFSGIEHRVDAGSINGRIFLNNASFGLYANIVSHDEYRQNKLATTQKTLQSLLASKIPYYPLYFHDNNNQLHRDAVQILVGVNAYQTLSVFELGQRTRLDQGILQITVITRLDSGLASKILRQTLPMTDLLRTDSDHFMQWEAKEFIVDNKKNEIEVGVDGENEVYTSPVNIHILPKKLRLMVPPEDMRSRPRWQFSGSVVTRLWKVATNKQSIN